MNLAFFFVTERDISAGVRGDPAKCPLTLALNRIPAVPEQSYLRSEDCPRRMKDFYMAFDRGVPMNPTSLILDLDLLRTGPRPYVITPRKDTAPRSSSGP